MESLKTISFFAKVSGTSRRALLVALIFTAASLVSSEDCETSEFRKQYTVTCDSRQLTRDYCREGQKVNDPCNDDDVCGYCPASQYQDGYTNCKTCKPCTTEDECPNGQVLTRSCFSNRDAVCGCPPCPSCPSCPSCPTEPTVTCQPCPTVPNTTCPSVEPCEPCPTVAEYSSKTTSSEALHVSDSFVTPCSQKAVQDVSSEDLLAFILASIALNILLGFCLLVCVIHYCRYRKKGKEGNKRDEENELPMDRVNHVNGGERGGKQRNDEQRNPKLRKEEVPLLDKSVRNSQDANGGIDTCNQPKRYDDAGSDVPPGADVTDDVDNKPRGAEGGEPLPGDEDNTKLTVDIPKGAEGGDSRYESQSVQPSTSSEPKYVNTTNHNNSEKLDQLEFIDEKMGDQVITETEVNELANLVCSDYLPRTKSSPEKFYRRLQIPESKYDIYAYDTRDAKCLEDKVFGVLQGWRKEFQEKRKDVRHNLMKMDIPSGNAYVNFVNSEIKPPCN